jgi:hypothetical protein
MNRTAVPSYGTLSVRITITTATEIRKRDTDQNSVRCLSKYVMSRGAIVHRTFSKNLLPWRANSNATGGDRIR